MPNELDDIMIDGVQPIPPRIIVYGQEGVGKSSFAAGAPDPFFVMTEDGAHKIPVKKTPRAKDYETFIKYLQLVVDDGRYKTLVIDTIDWLERLIHTETAKRAKKVSFADIPYGGGPKLALDLWSEVISGLDYAWSEKGMGVILLAHAKVDKFNDPEGQTYDRYTLRLDKEADAVCREWADAVLFATRKQRTEKVGTGFRERHVAKAVGADGGERVLRTNWSPAASAKNRYGITGEIPLDWDEFAKYLV